jgi:hypothetical protein
LVRVSHQVQVVTSATAWKVEESGVCQRERGVGMRSHLGWAHSLTPAQASRILLAGRDVAKLEVLRRAGVAGLVNPDQMRVVAKEFAGVADAVGGDLVDRALESVVGFAKDLDSQHLRHTAARAVGNLAPQVAEERERLEVVKEERKACDERFLRFTTSGGVTRFEGALPGERGKAFRGLVLANARHIRKALAGAPAVPGVPMTREQFQADGLSALVDQAARGTLAPARGGDRPRVTVTITLTELQKALDEARPGWGVGAEGWSVGAIRRLACDAGIIPMVLGTDGQVLDVGQEHRLVTWAIRRALEARDGGCVFAGCDRPPEDCHAHHLVPWWAGGATSLQNMALVCEHHHPIVEPPHPVGATGLDSDPPDRWRIELDANGIPVTIPPTTHDPTRAPMYHPRHQRPVLPDWLTGGPPDPPPGAPPGEGGTPPDPATAP